ncbi:unnamed protein product [Arabidopsis halleri]
MCSCWCLGGVEIPVNKRIEYSLQYIHGIDRIMVRFNQELKSQHKRVESVPVSTYIAYICECY